MLAGGASRRMGGRPKGLELVGGARSIDRVVAALRPSCNRVLLAANDPDAGQWISDAVVVRDRHPGAGGMAGIEAALALAGSALAVAWDMPFVNGPLIELIASTARKTGADVVVPEDDSPYGVEPFCAYYDARCLPPLSAFLAGGGGSAREFLALLPAVHRLSREAVEATGDPGRLFLSVNTDEDLARARALAAGRD